MCLAVPFRFRAEYAKWDGANHGGIGCCLSQRVLQDWQERYVSSLEFRVRLRV